MSQLKIQYETAGNNQVEKAGKLWKNSAFKAWYCLGR